MTHGTHLRHLLSFHNVKQRYITESIPLKEENDRLVL